MAEVLVYAGLRKSELIYETRVVKYSSLAVHVIRRAKLVVLCAGRATGDAVRIAPPSPAHRVSDDDVHTVGHKT